jgi:hypothetical protein
MNKPTQSVRCYSRAPPVGMQEPHPAEEIRTLDT